MRYLIYDSSRDTIRFGVHVGTSPHPLSCVDVQDNDEPDDNASPVKKRKKDKKVLSVDYCEHGKQRARCKV